MEELTLTKEDEELGKNIVYDITEKVVVNKIGIRTPVGFKGSAYVITDLKVERDGKMFNRVVRTQVLVQKLEIKLRVKLFTELRAQLHGFTRLPLIISSQAGDLIIDGEVMSVSTANGEKGITAKQPQEGDYSDEKALVGGKSGQNEVAKTVDDEEEEVLVDVSEDQLDDFDG